MEPNTTSGRSFWRLKTVVQRTGKSKSAIYGDPTFPRPIKIGVKASAWNSLSVENWMQQKVDQAAAKSAARSGHQATAQGAAAQI